MTDFDEEEIAVLKFLSDGKEHFDDPDIDDYYDICEELEKFGYVDIGLTKDDGIKLTRKGKKVWNEIVKKQANNLSKLEFEILNTICLHEKEIASTEKGTKHIYDYLPLYTKTEITECTLKMQRKGWIKCFCDEGPAYYHTLLDNGRIVLRNYIEQNGSIQNQVTEQVGTSIDEELVNALSEFFYEKEDIIPYIAEVQREKKNMGVVIITAKYLNDRKISDRDQQYLAPLHNVLANHHLYHAKSSNWRKQIGKRYKPDL